MKMVMRFNIKLTTLYKKSALFIHVKPTIFIYQSVGYKSKIDVDVAIKIP
ncbi:Uncharacterised protein [Leminorella grimontii]|nr:hypothetical protein GLGR_1033 [Leminorella grimontii ATCC 33999 = DSM 5078]VFS58019.1 Uncharacterised protein [Leminorella grimontii]